MSAFVPNDAFINPRFASGKIDGDKPKGYGLGDIIAALLGRLESEESPEQEAAGVAGMKAWEAAGKPLGHQPLYFLRALQEAGISELDGTPVAKGLESVEKALAEAKASPQSTICKAFAAGTAFALEWTVDYLRKHTFPRAMGEGNIREALAANSMADFLEDEWAGYVIQVSGTEAVTLSFEEIHDLISEKYGYTCNAGEDTTPSAEPEPSSDDSDELPF